MKKHPNHTGSDRSRFVRDHPHTLVILLALAAFFFFSLSRFVGAGKDDVFISLWAGENLARGKGLVNYNFERVEISSSLLHCVLIALITKLAPRYTYALNKVFGLLAGLSVLLAIYAFRALLINFRSRVVNLIALLAVLLLLATYPAFLYWSLGGLETPYQTLILLLYGIFLIKHWRHQGATSRDQVLLLLLQCLYVLVRPEGFILVFFTASYAVVYRACHRESSGSLVKLVLVPLLFFVGISAVRYVHFGLLFPNPVYAKMGGLRIDRGLLYLKAYYTSSPLALVQLGTLLAIALWYSYHVLRSLGNLTAFFLREFEPLILLGLVLMNHVFILLTSGDHMEYNRFVVPVIPLLVILTVTFATRLLLAALERLSNARASLFRSESQLEKAILTIGLLLFLSLWASNAAAVSRDLRGRPKNFSLQSSISQLPVHLIDPEELHKQILLLNRAGRRDMRALLPFIEDHLPSYYDRTGPNGLVIVTYQMGFFPYYIKHYYPHWKVYFIDTLGLCDPRVSQLPLQKNPLGVGVGQRMDLIISGKAGVLSDYVIAKHPNIIYMLKASEEQQKVLAAEGFALVWDPPGAKIFFREPEDEIGRDT